MITRCLLSAHDAALHSLRTGDCREFDNICMLNLNVCKELFAGLVLGVYQAAVIRSGLNVYFVTRSARLGVPVQVTVFWNRDGELISLSHRNIKSGDDLAGELPSGKLTLYDEI